MLAERIGWPAVYAVMGCAMLAVLAVTCFAPDSHRPDIAEDEHELRQAGELTPRVRMAALLLVAALWTWSIATVLVFMVRSLGAAPDARPDPTAFVAVYGPIIVIATVIVPAVIAAILQSWRRAGRYSLDHAAPVTGAWDRVVDHGYSTLILPLADLVARLRWGAILVLALILTYRITDSIWGGEADVEGGKIRIAEGWAHGPEIDKGARWDPAELGPVVADLLAKARPAVPVYGA